MMPGNGQLSVPPGFRFHPTDEELLYYYLRKKVSYEPIDLDVIREVDLNKLEPWDLKDKCRIGSGPQNEWYFFSHKDKKYPTGTRTNRATTAGFWKATGRDKAIYLGNSKRIGMRKTLVFYTGRAPHGQKTDWIMHEYRLDDDNAEIQEGGWVVCRVFQKKNHCKLFLPETTSEEHLSSSHVVKANTNCSLLEPRHTSNVQMLHEYTLDGSMHLPQLLCPESNAHHHHHHHHHHHQPSLLSSHGLQLPASSSMDINESSHHHQSFLRLSTTGGCTGLISQQQEKFFGDWSFLDKLLNSHQISSCLDQTKCHGPSLAAADGVPSSAHQRFPCSYQLAFEPDIFKFSK